MKSSAIHGAFTLGGVTPPRNRLRLPNRSERMVVPSLSVLLNAFLSLPETTTTPSPTARVVRRRTRPITIRSCSFRVLA